VLGWLPKFDQTFYYDNYLLAESLWCYLQLHNRYYQTWFKTINNICNLNIAGVSVTYTENSKLDVYIMCDKFKMF